MYVVTNAAGANLRAEPAGTSSIVKTLKHFDAVAIDADITAVNTGGGVKTQYLATRVDGALLWLSKKLVESPDEVVARVYSHAIGCTHSGSDKSKVKTLSALDKYKTLTCNIMTSLCAQELGVLASGALVGHTAKADGKSCVKDAVYNYTALKDYETRLVWVNKKFDSLPAKYKKPGVILYYNSNSAVVGTNGIYTCNESSSQMKNGKYTSVLTNDKSRYVYKNNVLAVYVPEVTL